jgi:hypothetical protein
VDYLTNSEVLIIDGQKAIVDKLGIGIKKMEESEIFLMEKGLAQTIFLIQSNLRSKVKYQNIYLGNHLVLQNKSHSIP